MTGIGVFIVGFLVTLIVAAALALLIYAAMLDGRDAKARVRADRSPLATPPTASTPATASTAPAPSGSIFDIARGTAQFSTLASALDCAGLAQTLLDGGPYTVFAPNDEAFAMLPEGVVDSLLAAPETLANILAYHLVPRRMDVAEVATLRRASTVQGEDLWVSNNGTIGVDGARVIRGDIEATNGLIHVIDRVLLPARF